MLLLLLLSCTSLLQPPLGSFFAFPLQTSAFVRRTTFFVAFPALFCFLLFFLPFTGFGFGFGSGFFLCTPFFFCETF